VIISPPLFVAETAPLADAAMLNGIRIRAWQCSSVRFEAPTQLPRERGELGEPVRVSRKAWSGMHDVHRHRGYALDPLEEVTVDAQLKNGCRSGFCRKLRVHHLVRPRHGGRGAINTHEKVCTPTPLHRFEDGLDHDIGAFTKQRWQFGRVTWPVHHALTLVLQKVSISKLMDTTALGQKVKQRVMDRRGRNSTVRGLPIE
jgi:hypothetical protein